MVSSKTLHIGYLAAALLLLTAAGCKKFDGDVTRPAWVHLDRMEVVRAASGDNERASGWFTHDIDGVELIAHMQGSNKEESWGTYQLPCQAPVMRDGVAEYIILRPVVKQNGIAGTRINYTCMQSDTMRNVRITPGQTTYLGVYDSASGTSVSTVNYRSNRYVQELYFENFEPLATTIRLTPDTVEWITNDTAGARSGSGYARIATHAEGNGTYFEIIDSMVVTDPGKFLYLEMDYRTDVEFRIGLRCPLVNGGNDYTYYAINLYPRENWTKIYINLGKLWGQMNHYNTFHVVFQTLNKTQQEGYTYIDNLKLICW